MVIDLDPGGESWKMWKMSQKSNCSRNKRGFHLMPSTWLAHFAWPWWWEHPGWVSRGISPSFFHKNGETGTADHLQGRGHPDLEVVDIRSKSTCTKARRQRETSAKRGSYARQGIEQMTKAGTAGGTGARLCAPKQTVQFNSGRTRFAGVAAQYGGPLPRTNQAAAWHYRPNTDGVDLGTVYNNCMQLAWTALLRAQASNLSKHTRRCRFLTSPRPAAPVPCAGSCAQSAFAGRPWRSHR